jgi:hypothetical protein
MNRPRHKLLKPLILIACIPLTIFLITAALVLSFGETPSLEAIRSCSTTCFTGSLRSRFSSPW